MPIRDQDRFFSGQLNASMPKHIIGEGALTRLINARFIEGAITNAVGFDKIDFEIPESLNKYVSNGNVTYKDILSRGDIQLFAPLRNTSGTYLIIVISGFIFSLDMESLVINDITPIDSYLPSNSNEGFPLSYLGNDGGIYGVGSYLVIFNYPNRPIFINQNGARISNAGKYEMPPSRLGVTAGSRAFVISGNNIMYASDPLGGASSLAPLTFQETLDSVTPGAYEGQVFTIGSSLDSEYVTCMTRVPRLFDSSQEFLAQSILISTKIHKHIVAAESQRSTWDTTQFISYAGNGDGIAGSLASTNLGSSVIYISNTGRIKTFSQDTDRNNSLTENYFDEDLGQYLCCNESSFYFRNWYSTLDHSRSVIKFNGDRLYATVAPTIHPSIDRFGNQVGTITHRALATATLSSDEGIGARASLAWEGFYDWLNPVSIVVLNTITHFIAKDIYGNISIYQENSRKVDNHKSTIYTRGYFSNVDSKSKTLTGGTLYFRRLDSTVKIKISYLVNNEWVCGVECEGNTRTVRFTIPTKCKTDSWSIPLKIEIDHHGCIFELESIRVVGEEHKEEK